MWFPAKIFLTLDILISFPKLPIILSWCTADTCHCLTQRWKNIAIAHSRNYNLLPFLSQPVVKSVGSRMRHYVASLWFLFSNFTWGYEGFLDCILRDQALVAKRLMESQGLKEWQEWVIDQGKCVVKESKNERRKWYKIFYLYITTEQK